MKKLLFLAVLLAGFTMKAQVKVGDNPTTINANSILEMESTNKGMLLPRVALTGTAAPAPLAAHVAGMAVYNTATAGDATPGYYVNNGTAWVKMADATVAEAADSSKDAWVENAGNTVVSSGNVGIGTATPGAMLDVSTTDNTKIYLSRSIGVIPNTDFGSINFNWSLTSYNPGIKAKIVAVADATGNWGQVEQINQIYHSQQMMQLIL